MKFVFYLSSLLIISVACSQNKAEYCHVCGDCGLNLNRNEVSLEEALSKSNKMKSASIDSLDLKESLAKIVEKYGEQWDFCHCVVVSDSIDKAIKEGNTDDKLIERWDYIDNKCQAFKIQDPSRTPEQREAHERRVQRCLKEAGLR
jgi:hypothetical protein